MTNIDETYLNNNERRSSHGVAFRPIEFLVVLLVQRHFVRSFALLLNCIFSSDVLLWFVCLFVFVFEAHKHKKKKKKKKKKKRGE